VKGEGKAKTERLKISKNRTEFGIQLVMISPRENYDFWWLDISICYLSNGF